MIFAVFVLGYLFLVNIFVLYVALFLLKLYFRNLFRGAWMEPFFRV